MLHFGNTTTGSVQEKRRTKGIKQLNADLNNLIYSFLKTLALPSGRLIPDRLVKRAVVWKAARRRASTTEGKQRAAAARRKPPEAQGPALPSATAPK